MKEVFANRGDEEIIEIFAALTRRQYNSIKEGEVAVEIPSNVEMTNKAGSSTLFFTCYGKKAANELADGLDASSVSWQEVYTADDAFGNKDRIDKSEETENRDSGHSS